MQLTTTCLRLLALMTVGCGVCGLPAQLVAAEQLPTADILAEQVSLDDMSMKDIWDSASSEPAVGSDTSGLTGAEEILNPAEEYHYAAFGRSDPFVRPTYVPAANPGLATGQAGDTAGGDLEIPLVSALQVSLNLLRVRGIWEISGGERKALIAVSGGSAAMQGLVAKVGDPIGLSGKIISIDANSVVTRQYKIRADGSREFEDVVLRLGPEIAANAAGADARKGKIILSPGRDPQLQLERDPTAPATEIPVAPAANTLPNQTTPPISTSGSPPTSPR